jgi:hypothetical protein
MRSFLFNLNQKVRLIDSQEHGTVVGRAEYSSDENRYLIRYKAGDGRLTEVWWNESAIADSE